MAELNKLMDKSQLLTECKWQVLTQLTQLTPQEKTLIFEDNAKSRSNPFSSYEFLSILEESDSVGQESGWLPHHLVLRDSENQLLGLLICYQKEHSYGEYVFDWAWADAYHRNGIHYYPKLLSAIPFSPVPCDKWLTSSDLTFDLTLEDITPSLFDWLKTKNFTGFHYLFPEQLLTNKPEQLMERQGNQFHWFNRHPESGKAYTDFDDFLSALTARKRKSIKKERQQVSAQQIKCVWKTGSEVTSQELELFYQFYHNTYYKRGMQGYLTFSFFNLLFQSMSDSVRLLTCYQQDTLIACALYFVSNDTLYGRYWGCDEEIPVLHFEACYYQAIEFAIKHGLKTFNPGTQGEHKIPRGFEPTTTYSYHHLQLDPFHDAIQNFCLEEAKHNALYMAECAKKLPFRKPE